MSPQQPIRMISRLTWTCVSRLVLLGGLWLAPHLVRAQPTAERVYLKVSPAAQPAFAQAVEHATLGSSKNGAALRVQTGRSSLDAALEAVQLVALRPVFRTSPQHQARHAAWGLDRWYEAIYQPAPQQPTLAASLGPLADLEYVVPARLVRHHGQPPPRTVAHALDSLVHNDPLFPRQWHLDNPPQDHDIRAPEAHALTTGHPSVVVQVIDTGLDLTHPDLLGALWVNADEIPGNGLDDDENGYVDDVHGYNFADDRPEIDLVDPQILDNSHGMHVAGLLAARNNNRIGVSSIAGGDGRPDSGIRIMMGVTFGTGPRVDGPFAEAIVYGADNGAVISNNSWGYENPGIFSPILRDAIDYFTAMAGRDGQAPMQGGLVIASAGNNASNLDYYPAYFDNVVAVAATTRLDERAPASNFGPWVDLAAPGGTGGPDDLLSTVHTLQGSYGTFSGTSMAAPLVSGVAALIVSHTPGLRAEEVRTRLRQTGRPIPGASIGRRLDAFQALVGADVIPPAQIVRLEATTEQPLVGNTVTLSWTAVGDDQQTGTAALYDLRYSTAGPITQSTFADAQAIPLLRTPLPAGRAEQFVATGLPLGVRIWFSLVAVDEFGNRSNVSNSPSVFTGFGPRVQLSTSSIEADVRVGRQTTRTLTVFNESSIPVRMAVLGLPPIAAPDSLARPADAPRTDLGSDNFGYRVLDSRSGTGPTFWWTDIQGVGTPLPLGDDELAPLILPFPFPFYGNLVDTLYVSDNGHLTTSSEVSEWKNDPLPSLDKPDGVIAPLWRDLNPDDGGAIHYYHDAAGGRVIVQYTEVPSLAGTPAPGRFTFQVHLYETGTIAFLYKQVEGTTKGTVGLESPNGQDGLMVVHDAPFLEDNLALTFPFGPSFVGADRDLVTIPPSDSVHLRLELDAAQLGAGPNSGFLDFQFRFLDRPIYRFERVNLALNVTSDPFPFALNLTDFRAELDSDGETRTMLTLRNTNQVQRAFTLEVVPAEQPTHDPVLPAHLVAGIIGSVVDTDRSLGVFDAATPGDVEAVGALPLTYAGEVLYGQRDRLLIVERRDRTNPASEQTLMALSPGLPPRRLGPMRTNGPNEEIFDLAQDPFRAIVYAVSTNYGESFLYRVNPSTGHLTFVGPLTGHPVVAGLAVDNEGRLWGHDLSADLLIEIDPETASTRRVGALGFRSEGPQSMTVDRTTGQVLMAAFNKQLNRAELRAIDTATGASEFLGVIGEGRQVSFLASTSVQLATTVPQEGSVAPGDVVAVPLHLTARQLHAGTYRADLRIQATDLPGQPSVRLPLQAIVQAEPEAAFAWPTLTFGEHVIGEGFTRRIVVANTGRAPLEVQGVVEGSAAFSVAPTAVQTIRAGFTDTLLVRYQPQTAGEETATLAVRSESGASLDQTRPLSGRAVEPPRLRDPESSLRLIGYADQAIQDTVFFHNDGEGPLTFAQTTLQAPGTTLDQFTPPLLTASFADGLPTGWSVSGATAAPMIWRSTMTGGLPNITGGDDAAVALSAETSTGVRVDAALLTPPVVPTSTSLSVSFMLNYQDTGGSDAFSVELSTDAGATWTVVKQWTDDVGSFLAVPGQRVSLDLAPFLTTSTPFQLRFRFTKPIPTESAWYAQVDEVVISSEADWLTVTPSAGTVAPGDSVALVVEADLRRLGPQAFDTLLGFTTNDPAQKKRTLPLRLDARAPVQVDAAPATLLAGQSLALPLMLTGAGTLMTTDFALSLSLDPTLARVEGVATDGTLLAGVPLTVTQTRPGQWDIRPDEPMTRTWVQGSGSAGMRDEGPLLVLQLAPVGPYGIVEPQVTFSPAQDLPAVAGPLGAILIRGPYGDANLDGRLSAEDVPALLTQLSQRTPLPPAVHAMLDVSGNGSVSVLDASLLLHRVADPSFAFPVEEQAAPPPGPVTGQWTWTSPRLDPNDAEVTLRVNDPGEALRAVELTVPPSRTEVTWDQVAFSLPPDWQGQFQRGLGDTLRVVMAGRTALPAGPVVTLRGSGQPDAFLWEQPASVRMQEQPMVPLAETDLTSLLEAPGAVQLYTGYPNPFRDHVTIRYEAPRASAVHLTVYNALGRRVRTLVRGDRPAGRFEVAWDGRDDQGRPTASGLYLIRLEAGQTQRTSTINRVR